MRSLRVELGDRSYPIHIGGNLLQQPELLLPHLHSERTLIITNETVAPLYLDSLLEALADKQVDSLILPDGEVHKTLATTELIFNHLLENRYSRDTTLIALGGGVIGDIVGFAAACYQRGVEFVQIPTTLLSQVDSSVGGKTGVNHPLGKNMIGAFYQPQCVLASTDTLASLPQRELSAGLAEVIKYGLIADAAFFSWLEDNIVALLALDETAINYAVERSCQCKAEVVASDELEQSGRRALLNLGHTFGHAIETGMGYGNWLHGEAVGCGMLLAAEFSARLGWLNDEQVMRSRALITAAKLPTKLPNEMDCQQMLDLMAVDKKVKQGKLRLVLLRDIGEAVLSSDFDQGLLRETIQDFSQRS